MNGYAVSDARVETSPDTTRGTATLLFLFVGSGCSALIYEVVWFHRDRSLRLQYLAGLALDEYRSDQIYSAIEEYRHIQRACSSSPGSWKPS